MRPLARQQVAVAGLVFLLVLIPSGMASAHQGHSNAAAWDACEDLSLDARCAWSGSNHEIYRGTCRGIGDALMCVRNRPLGTRAVAAKRVEAEPRSAAPVRLVAAGMVCSVIIAILAFVAVARRRLATEPATRNNEK